MKEFLHIDAEALADEASRYLAAVEAFRAERCEPMWRAELPAGGAHHQPLPRSSPDSERRGAKRRQA